jgi:hypothetical protein
MEDDIDGGIHMPRYKGPCRYERRGDCHVDQCVHLHQKQVDKFAAEDFEAMPLNRNMDGRGFRRR